VLRFFWWPVLFFNGSASNELFPCIEAVQLRGLRIRQVKNYDIELLAGALDEPAPIDGMHPHALLSLNLLPFFGEISARRVEYRGIELDVIHPFQAGMLQGLDHAPVQPTAY